MVLGIRVSKIEKERLNELEGYAWLTDKETKEQFEIMKSHSIEYKEGEVCLDLIESNGDILETITIPLQEYIRVRG